MAGNCTLSLGTAEGRSRILLRLCSCVNGSRKREAKVEQFPTFSDSSVALRHLRSLNCIHKFIYLYPHAGN